MHTLRIELCREHGISVIVTNARAADAPAYEIKADAPMHNNIADHCHQQAVSAYSASFPLLCRCAAAPARQEPLSLFGMDGCAFLGKGGIMY